MSKKRSVPHGRTMSKRRPLASHKVVSRQDLVKNVDVQREMTREAALPSAPKSALSAAPQSVLKSSYGRPVRRSGAGLSTDYQYITSDLKRIAFLASGTFVVLIGLSFIIK